MLDYCIEQYQTDKGCSEYKTYYQFEALTFGNLTKCHTLSYIYTEFFCKALIND